MPVDLHFNRLEDWAFLKDREGLLERAARLALASGGSQGGEVSFTFVSAEEIRELNREYLGRDRPTDVIAFNLGQETSLLGDVYVSPEVAALNAADLGEDPLREILRLVVHGSLHVIGFDHPEGAGRDASPMFVLQEELLHALSDE